MGWDEGKVLTVTIIHKQQWHHHCLLIGCHIAVDVAPWTLIVIVVVWPWSSLVAGGPLSSTNNNDIRQWTTMTSVVIHLVATSLREISARQRAVYSPGQAEHSWVITIRRPVVTLSRLETSYTGLLSVFMVFKFWKSWETKDQTAVVVFDGPGNFRSWAVLVQSSLCLFPVLGLDFQALIPALSG